MSEAPPRVVPPPLVPPPPQEAEGPLNPWTSIWTRPRATLRLVIETDPRRWIFALAALGGIDYGLSLASAPGVGDVHPPAVLFAAAVAAGARVGLLSLFVMTALARAVGAWLGGHGTARDVMAAIAWSQVPSIFSLLLWAPRAVLLGTAVFQPTPPSLEDNPPAALFIGLLALAEAILAFWGFVIAVMCVAEAHRFTSWRAFWTLMIAGLLIVIPTAVLVGVIQVLRG